MIGIKSNSLSIFFKDSGNVCFRQKMFKDALVSYNMAISLAATKKDLALAFANRCAVFMELKKYDEALKNIQWARENDYENIQKLNDREEKCKKLKEKQVIDPLDDPFDFFQLSYPPNPKIPFIVECLEMRKTKKFGRGIYATRDLKTGDIIAIEDSVIRRMFPPSAAGYSICCNCLKSCNMNLIPCLKNSTLMFCSTTCREKIYEKIEDMTCLLKIGNDYAHEKIYADIVEKFGGREKLLEFLKQNDVNKLNKSVFDYDWNALDEAEYNRNLAICFLSFTDSFALQPKMKKWSYVEPPQHLAKGNQYILDLIKHACGLMSLNSKCIRYGALGLAFGNLFNHSCLSNVQRVQIENKVAFYMSKPVKAGEQLFESYYMDDDSAQVPQMNLYDRQLMFNFIYNFSCECYACKHDLTPDKLSKVIPEWSNVREAIKNSEKAYNQGNSIRKCREQLKVNSEIIKQCANNKESIEIHILMMENFKLFDEIAHSTSFPFHCPPYNLRGKTYYTPRPIVSFLANDLKFTL